MTTFTRAFPLMDCQIRADGTGRTVVMYAALFGVKTAIHDQQGRYTEELHPTSFNKTVADRGTRFGVFYNHAKTLYGTPSERGSVPLGSPIEPPKPDGTGLLTVTRYNKTPQSDEILAAIENGDIRSQSFTGRFLRSTPDVPRLGYKPRSDGSLVDVMRMETAMTEYGPTPIPAYDEPMLVGVRSLADQIDELDDAALTALARRLSLTTLDEPAQGSDTSILEAVTEAPLMHAGRSLNARVRAELIARGIAS